MYNSRPYEDSIRRNRECPYCKHRFATIEVLAEPKARGRPTVVPLKPKKTKKRRLTPQADIVRDIDLMSDEELEAAIHEGDLTSPMGDRESPVQSEPRSICFQSINQPIGFAGGCLRTVKVFPCIHNGHYEQPSNT